MGGRSELPVRARRRLRPGVLVLLAGMLAGGWLLAVAPEAAAAIILTPSEGPPGTSVVVAGTDYDGSCRVEFDGAVSGSSSNCTELSFVVPGSASPGSHQVVVIGTAGGSSNALGSSTFTVDPEVTTTVEATTTTGAVATVPATAPSGSSVPGTVPGTGSGTVPATLPGTVASSVPVFPELTCAPSTPPVARLTITPARGPAGDDVRVLVDWSTGGTCSVRPGLLTFDASTVGGPIPSTTGPVERAFTIPAGTEPGPHAVAVVAADDPARVLATAPFAVELAADQASSSSGAPVVAGLVALAVVAVGAGVLIAHSRKGEPPAAPMPDDPCRADRALLADARLAAAKARAEVEQAQQRARAADERAERLRRELGEGGDEDGDRPPLPFALPVIESERTLEPYLLEHENAHAPRRPNGKRGWYRDQRTQPIRGIVMVGQRSAGPKAARSPVGEDAISAGDVASGLTIAPRATSAHVAVDRDGVVGLLPDDHVALHRPDVDEADETLLVVLVVASPDGTVDDATLRQAAAWCSPRVRRYDVPARRVTGDDWAGGAKGFLEPADIPGVTARHGHPGPEFPWDRFLPLLRRREGAAIPGILPGRESESDDAREAEVEQAESEARRAREEAQQAEQKARQSEQRAVDLGGAVTRCECRDLPAPEALVVAPEDTNDDEGGGYYLLEHENPHGDLRDNGKHGWYYPSRTQSIRGIVVHTAESMDAEGIAAFLAAVVDPAAAHVVVDTEITVPLLPDDATAFHAYGGNSAGLGIEIAYVAARWGTQPATEEMLVIRSAAWCGARARLHDIPVRRITIEQWEAGERGFISHAELDPANRSDPGPDFPWDRFLALTARVAGQSGRSDTPAPDTKGLTT